MTGTAVSIRLPFPPPALNPNARPDRWEKAAAVKQYRRDCLYLALKAGREQGIVEPPVSMTVTFVLKGLARRRDWDNLIASFKSGLDGLTDALLPDDSIQVISRLQLAVAVGDPAVVVDIEAAS